MLLARTVAGLLAHAVGWRPLFFAAAGLMLVVTALLRRVIPASSGMSGLTYPTAAAFALLWVGRDSLGCVLVGVLVLDVGVQGLHVLNQRSGVPASPVAAAAT
jgi:MFS family permease